MDTIIKKENGEISTIKRIKQTSTEVFLSGDEQCFSNSINQKNIEALTMKEIDNAFTLIKGMLSTITVNKKNFYVIELLYNSIIQAKNQEDLTETLNLFYEKYKIILGHIYKNYKSKYVKALSANDFPEMQKKYPDLFISIFIKQIMKMYYHRKIAQLNKAEICELEKDKNNGISIDELFSKIGESFEDVNDVNGLKQLAGKVLLDTIDIIFDQVQKHLCWNDCANAFSIKCPKITDRYKKAIDNYEFITDGYQIYNEDGELTSFCVTGCSNFNKEKRKPLKNSKKTIDEKHLSKRPY